MAADDTAAMEASDASMAEVVELFADLGEAAA
jgi:hypothetical protein